MASVCDWNPPRHQQGLKLLLMSGSRHRTSALIHPANAARSRLALRAQAGCKEKEGSMQRRVVITGLGVVAPNGVGKEDFWNACVSGRSGVRHVTRFDASPLPTRIAGEVANFEPEAFGITPQEALYTDRNTQFALAAANLALQDAGLIDALSEVERN